MGAGWKLHSEQLAFTLLPGCHFGANIGNVIMQMVDHYGLQGKVHQLFYTSVIVNIVVLG